MGYEIKRYIPFWGTTVARIFVSAIISMPLFVLMPYAKSFVFFVLLYIGFTFRWSPWVGMGSPLKDIFNLTARGFLLTGPAGFVADLYIFALSGLSMGIVYYIAYQLLFYHKE